MSKLPPLGRVQGKIQNVTKVLKEKLSLFKLNWLGEIRQLHKRQERGDVRNEETKSA